MEVRGAGPLDISALAHMLAEMHQQTELPVPPINTERLINKINEVVHRGVVFVAIDDEGKMAG